MFGARFSKDWIIVHDYTDKIEELDSFRGSKYVQSQIGNSYKQAQTFLKQGRWVLFVGTSCQIAGLNLFLKKKYDRLIAVDVVCHGVPSPKVWNRYLEDLTGDQINKITDIQFGINGLVGKNIVLFANGMMWNIKKFLLRICI